MAINIPVVFLDADDTLWSISPLYLEARKKLSCFIEAQFGVSKIGQLYVSNFFSCLDCARVAASKHSLERFKESILLAYAYICGYLHYPYLVEGEKELTAYIDNLFTITPEKMKARLYPDTVPALARLSKYTLIVILTMGDAEHQLKKISAVKDVIGGYLGGVEVCAEKNKEVYKEVVKKYANNDFSCVWMVGNSIKTDINPAAAAGIRNLILVSRSDVGWKEFETESPLIPDFYKVSDLIIAEKEIYKWQIKR
jgi:putative hydrolase of the HAD superfamily